ncbi:unnamed protein product [Eruca vesicaria subsp. sativa]|uniref:ENT domain-containing protein n=1 Tax=Eruca vesicaria subsp. sativa TaxID=29727 RepID=A0ABC8M5B8_ERUVS|nr:unnamed protein product [Eruca vesicaria subsp. sativa]
MRFRKGSRVEVLSLKEAPYGAWRAAEILSGNGHIYYVRYYSYGLAKDAPLEERVARKSIRPCPPQIDVQDRWEAGELVEVLDNVSWKTATVLEELSGRYYVVRLLGAALELTVHKVNLRARQCWQDETWVLIGKVSCSVKSSTLTGSDVNQNIKPHEKSVVSVRVLKRPSPCESAESFTGSPKKKMRSMEEGDAAWCGKLRLQASVNNGFRQMVSVRSKRSSECVVGTGSSVYNGCCDTDACSVGSCSPIRYDESDTSASFLDGSSSQDADPCSSDAESSKGCREEAVRRPCRPELYTYRRTLGKLFASGPLDWNQEASLTDLRLSLNISTDEHLMEIRNLKCWQYFPAMWNQVLHIVVLQEGSYSDCIGKQNGRKHEQGSPVGYLLLEILL